jgi:hypothetical protein
MRKVLIGLIGLVCAAFIVWVAVSVIGTRSQVHESNIGGRVRIPCPESRLTTWAFPIDSLTGGGALQRASDIVEWQGLALLDLGDL